MKPKQMLPRGIRRRGDSLIVCFALGDGTVERRSVGPVAVQWAKQQREIWKRQVAEGRYVKRQPKVPLVSHTVADLWEVYLRDYRNRSGKDGGRLKIAWVHLKPMFDSTLVTEVSTNMVNYYIETRRAEGMQNGTINRETALLRAMFKLGTRVTPPMVERMPAFPPRLKENPPRTGFVTDREYAQLKAHCDKLWLRALIAVAYSFGFRKGELLNLRVRQIDLLDQWIELESGTTKNGEARKVHMTTEVRELMASCVRGKNPDGYVFTRDDGSPVVDPREDWYTLCAKSGLGRYVPAKRKDGKDYERYVGLNLHDFRRSAIRNMTRRGVGDKTAMRISGHKTFSVFQRYNIVDEADLMQASELIERGRHLDAGADERVPALHEAGKTDTRTDTSNVAHS